MIKLLNGDAMHVIDKLNNEYAICFTSPPYNLASNNFECEKWDSVGKVQKYGDLVKDSIEDYGEWLTQIVKKLLTKCEYVFLNIQMLSGNQKDVITMLFNLKDNYCDNIIWNKGNGIPNGCNKKVMTSIYENIFIFSKKGNRAVGTKQWCGNVKNLVEIKGNQGNKFSEIHKAMFPIELADFIITNFTNENDKVLDCFGGLGTTALSCIKNNRECTIIELNKEYYRISLERVKEFLSGIKI